MSQARKGKLNYRCPACFMRDIDIDMFYDVEKKEFYCLRCCYRGSEENVIRLNQQARYKYKYIMSRVTDFSEDNKPIKTKKYVKGEY